MWFGLCSHLCACVCACTYRWPHRAGPRIFIGKLSKETTEADVKDYFMRFGYVMDVYLPKAKDNKTVSDDGWAAADLLRYSLAVAMVHCWHAVGGGSPVSAHLLRTLQTFKENGAMLDTCIHHHLCLLCPSTGAPWFRFRDLRDGGRHPACGEPRRTQTQGRHHCHRHRHAQGTLHSHCPHGYWPYGAHTHTHTYRAHTHIASH